MFFISFGKNSGRGEPAGRRKKSFAGLRQAEQKRAMALLDEFESTALAKKINEQAAESSDKGYRLKEIALKKSKGMKPAEKRQLDRLLRGSKLQNLKVLLLYAREFEKFAIARNAPEFLISYLRGDARNIETEMAAFKLAFRNMKSHDPKWKGRVSEKLKGIKASFNSGVKRIVSEYDRTPDAMKIIRQANAKKALLSELEAKQASPAQMKKMLHEIAEDYREYNHGLKRFAQLSNASHTMLKKIDGELALVNKALGENK